MIQFDFSELTAAQTHLASAVKRFQMLRRAVLEGGAMNAAPMPTGDVPKCLAVIENWAKQLGFNATQAGAKRGIQFCYAAARFGELHPNDLGTLITNIEYVLNALGDEADGRIFLALDAMDAAYYAPPASTFGPTFDAKFYALREDVECASKCIGIGQPTAAVFHMMRAMEGAVQALATKVGLTQTEIEWGKLLAGIHVAISAMPKGATRNAWSEAHANLYHVKQAWRNETMHPKQSYTVEQAKEIFGAVKTFMVQLADLL